MVQLLDRDIQTREVTAWGGVHVLHYAGSTCSQKLRIFVNLKGIGWQSHPIDISKHENYSPWFLGINPRGLVPVLVHDGNVHIESNDIITYLEAVFPAPRLIPEGYEDEVAKLLHHEDRLHLDLRTLSFRFIFDRNGPPRSAELLKAYEQTGAGTVQGVEDHEKAAQIDFWTRRRRWVHRPGRQRCDPQVSNRVRRTRQDSRLQRLFVRKRAERAGHRVVHSAPTGSRCAAIRCSDVIRI